MSVIDFPTDRARQQEAFEANYDGNCPKCRRAPSMMLNVHNTQFCVCGTCRTYWLIGWNCYEEWRHETEEQWERNADFLKACKEVQPLHLWRPPLPASINTFEAACRCCDEICGNPPDDGA